MSDYFTNFINRIYDELDSPEDYSPARISGWFLDYANLGQLNNLIGTDYLPVALTADNGVVTGYAINPPIQDNELSIYKLLFEYNYYYRLSRYTATSMMTVGQDWLNLREGDSSITRVNYNEVSKHLRSLANDAKDTLEKAVKLYLKHGSAPAVAAGAIAGDDTIGISNYLSTAEDRAITRRL